MKLTNSIVMAFTFFVGVLVFVLSIVALRQHSEKEFPKLAVASPVKNTVLEPLEGSSRDVKFSVSSYMHALEPMSLTWKVATLESEAIIKSEPVIKSEAIIKSEALEEPKASNLRHTLPLTPQSEVSPLTPLMPSVPDTPPEPSLSCRASFPPKCEMYPYLQFWQKQFSEEDCYQSPLRHPLAGKAPVSEQKYVVFQPDQGGWNNIRMAAETAMIFAHATGRTLVMPPVAVWYLLRRNRGESENESTFQKFFDLEKISEAQHIIPMEEFMRTVAAKGMLKQPVKIPLGGNLKQFSRNHDGLWKYLESACFVRKWEPGKFFIGFNISRVDTLNVPNSNNVLPIQGLQGVNRTRGLVIPPQPPSLPVTLPVRGQLNAISEDDHLKLFAAHGRRVLTYDKTMHDEKVIYFPGDYRNEYRILTHFYTYLYWADEHTEHIYKRIVRDRLHYHDAIFCAAGKMVKMLHEDAAALAVIANITPTNGSQPIEWNRCRVQTAARANKLTGGGDTRFDATYHAIHIRRGDFQYKETRLSAQQIYDNVKHLFDPSVTRILYISTDEMDITWFEPFREHFTLRFLRDYTAHAHFKEGHLNQNHIGMVEQTVCANAHTFVGTPLSTFTGYITRMRGYYRDDRYSRTFYTLPNHMYSLHSQTEIKGPFWAREFAVAHTEIDDYIAQQ